MDVSPGQAVWPDLTATEPYDSFVGPFPRAAFCEAWFEELGIGEPVTLHGNATTLPLVVHDGMGTIAGSADVTDYHSPLGEDIEGLVDGLLDLSDKLSHLKLDSLPERAAAAFASSFDERGRSHDVVVDEATAVLVLDSDDYLAQLTKKQRHEARRKRRRFVDGYGEPELVVAHADDLALAGFLDIHRKTKGAKGSFMTPAMEGFFRRLNEQPGWEIVELRTAGRLFASLFGYRSDDSYYLYNSGYDPEYREVSPGVVVLAELIQQLAGDGCMRFDFLKGDEAYKFRLGAEERPLSSIELR